MVSRDELTQSILRIIGETAAAKGLKIKDLGLDAPVDRRLGLDSLDWAAIVVKLEMETGIDPFVSGAAGELKTVSDFVDLYSKSAN